MDDLTTYENNIRPHAELEISCMAEWEFYDIDRKDWLTAGWVYAPEV